MVLKPVAAKAWVETGGESIFSEEGVMQLCETSEREKASWEVRQAGTGQHRGWIIHRAAALSTAGWSGVDWRKRRQKGQLSFQVKEKESME